MAEPNDIAHWRARIFERLLQMVFVLGLLTAVPSSLLSIKLGPWSIVVMEQPQVHRHGRVIGAEMLMCWPQPDGTMVPPGVFIPVAEESDLILALGAWAMRQACESVLLLERAGVDAGAGAGGDRRRAG